MPLLLLVLAQSLRAVLSQGTASQFFRVYANTHTLAITTLASERLNSTHSVCTMDFRVLFCYCCCSLSLLLLALCTANTSANGGKNLFIQWTTTCGLQRGNVDVSNGGRLHLLTTLDGHKNSNKYCCCCYQPPIAFVVKLSFFRALRAFRSSFFLPFQFTMSLTNWENSSGK